jgi:endonuclease YncB( thermonuclease family)
MRILIALVVMLFPSFAMGGQMVGVVPYIQDGDTFDLVMPDYKVSIRICGIDAPESGQPGAQEAWAKLSAMVYGKSVTCIQVGSKPRGTVCDGRSKPTNRNRIVAQCFVDNLDIGEEMVRSGNACSWTKFDGGYYQRKTDGKVCPR